MAVAVTGGAVERVDVDIDQPGHQPEPGDPALLDRLPPSHRRDRGITRFAMAAELQPSSELSMVGEQYPVERAVQDNRAGRDMAVTPAAIGGVGSEGQHTQ